MHEKYNLCPNILKSQNRDSGGLGLSRITLLYGIRKIAMNAVNPVIFFVHLLFIYISGLSLYFRTRKVIGFPQIQSKNVLFELLDKVTTGGQARAWFPPTQGVCLFH